MKIAFGDKESESDWVESGSWFKSFIGLGAHLAKASNSPNFAVSKIMIAVPKREFVSSALAIGYSIEKYLRADTLLRDIAFEDILNLEPGQILRIVRKVGLGEDDLHVQDVELASAAMAVNPNVKSIRINTRANGNYTTLALDKSRISSLAVLPRGFPTGLHKLPAPPKGLQPKDFPQIRWNWQASPGLVIYGEVDYFREQASTRIQYEPLQSVLGVSDTTLEGMGRIDYAENKFPHFVNLFEPVNSFPKLSDWPYSLPDLCEWVVLDGNRASTKLSAKEALIDRRVISIVEMGVPRSQGKALAAFTEQTANLRLVDASTLLAWSPPAGVQIWAWSNK